MIIAFIGGLGNQMFQYAIYKHAQLKGIPVSGDLSYYKKYECHNGYELSRIFGLNIDECQDQELRRFNSKTDILSRVIRKFIIKNYGINKKTIREEKSKYIPDLISLENVDRYLLGYWQSERYFKEHEEEIKNSFIFPPLADKKNIDLMNDIKNSLSVSIHVRRGDYINNANTKIYNNLGDTDYYSNAIKYIKSQNKNIKFYVFSNDVAWCKENLDLTPDTIFVDWNKGNKSYIDMQLMSMCKHNIIANSSFSWWGAWLNQPPKKIVIAPKQWFASASNYESSDIIPEQWIKI